MLHFEVITSGFEKFIDNHKKHVDAVAKKGMQKADETVTKWIDVYAPVHIPGYHIHGMFVPGGTLLDSFTIYPSTIGNYEFVSVYRMSGADNPAAVNGDYAFFQEEEFFGEHTKPGATTPYLRPSVEEGFDEMVSFVANELYLE